MTVPGSLALACARPVQRTASHGFRLFLSIAVSGGLFGMTSGSSADRFARTALVGAASGVAAAVEGGGSSQPAGRPRMRADHSTDIKVPKVAASIGQRQTDTVGGCIRITRLHACTAPMPSVRSVSRQTTPARHRLLRTARQHDRAGGFHVFAAQAMGRVAVAPAASARSMIACTASTTAQVHSGSRA